jgi:D-alanyl-D-alanine carboxypeptidase
MSYPKHTDDLECQGCNERLKDAHPMIESFFHVMKDMHPDLHTSCVYRDDIEQNLKFKQGLSNAKAGQSKHNLKPSLAIDLFQQNPQGRAKFDGVFMAKIYKQATALGYEIIWGGNFKRLKDFVHFELK